MNRILASGLCRTVLAAAGAALLSLNATAADQTVHVGPGISFSPAAVTVAPGEMVTWQFLAFHTSTSDLQTGSAEVWNSGFLSTGSFSHTFNTPGTYHFYCAVHSSPGGTAMNGVVVVTGAGATPTPTATPTAPPIATPTPTPTTPVLATATPTPVPPAPSATPISGAGAAGVPDLDSRGRLLLVLALGAAGVAALLLASRR
ncbi:MAG TPA: plastocyanin/azurin family copper-binding protein [Thermoanaerobaculia bacterium]